MAKSVYFQDIFPEIPRLLGLLNRNIGSTSYGCFDRQYWHYRVTDFSCARFQEAALTLALLYNLNLKENHYYKNSNILEWINASLNFWAKIQEKNGSFNEWYPRENSFVATSFTAYAVSECLLSMQEDLITDYGLVLSSLKKAGDWLLKRVEARVVNQTCGAIIALYNIYLLTKDTKYLSGAKEKIEFIKRSQSPEGWFMEYGGADIGYLSLAIDYLAKYYHKSKDDNARDILKKSISFIRNFVHPDGTFGGSYASRNTEYMIPSGFEIMAGYLGEARFVALAVREAIKNKGTVSVSNLDDRYLVYIGYIYLQSFLEAKEDLGVLDEVSSLKSTNYPILGIEIMRNDNHCFIYNYKKGGVFKLSSILPERNSADDWGVILKAADGRMYSSGWLNSEAVISRRDGSIQVDTCFQEIKQMMMNSMGFAALRFFQFLVSINVGTGFKIKNKLRDILITRKDKTGIKLRRIFSFENNCILINDRIEGARNIEAVIVASKASYIYVPSSCYYQERDLDRNVLMYRRKDMQKDSINILRKYDNSAKLIKAEFV